MCKITPPSSNDIINFVTGFHKKKPSKSTKGTTTTTPTTAEPEPTEPEEEIEEPAAEAATEVTKKYARRGRKANVLAGAMGGMNMERIRRRRMLGSFSEPMGQY